MKEISRNHQVKAYIEKTFCPEDEALCFIRHHSKTVGLPEIQVPIAVGKFLYLMAKIQRAKRILEIGTLGGYSTVCLARALPSEGQLLSLEVNPKHVEIAQLHIEKANLSDRVKILEGNASTLLDQLIAQHLEPFDLIFIDADKNQNQHYLDQSLQLAHPGTLILIDNLIPKGEQVGQPCNGEAVAVYQFNQYLSEHPLLEIAPITTIVGENGRVDAMGVVYLKDNY